MLPNAILNPTRKFMFFFMGTAKCGEQYQGTAMLKSWETLIYMECLIVRPVQINKQFFLLYFTFLPPKQVRLGECKSYSRPLHVTFRVITQEALSLSQRILCCKSGKRSQNLPHSFELVSGKGFSYIVFSQNLGRIPSVH